MRFSIGIECKERHDAADDLIPSFRVATEAAVSVTDFQVRPRLHIALIITNLGGGGAERTLLKRADGLINLGHRVDIVMLEPGIRYHQEIPAAARLILSKNASDALKAERGSRIPTAIYRWQGERTSKVGLRDVGRLLQALNWNPLLLPSASMYKKALFVADYVRKETPDCVLPSLPTAKVATLLAKSLLGSFPVVIPVVHNVLEQRHLRTRVRYRALMPHSDQIVTVSEGVRQSIASKAGMPKERITTIYNPVVTPRLVELSREIPDHLWLTGGGPPVILSAGRFNQVKDFPTLIQAFHMLSMVIPVRLILLGEGSQRKNLTALVRKLHLEDRVSMPGWVDNPYAFMARASLFVTSSRKEGLPGVLIEALACGCPCVSTDCPSGPAEILEGGRIGRLVPVADVEALAEAMRLTLEDPPPRTLLLKRAEYFSVENAAVRYERLITETVRNRYDRAQSGDDSESS